MDFMSKLGSKAGETFQNIKESDQAKKALSYAEIPGLALQVGKQESIVKKAYQELGEAYYSEHKDDMFDTLAPTMQTITEALEKIEEIKALIEEKKAYDPKKDAAADVASAEETAQTEIVVEATQIEKTEETDATQSETAQTEEA